MPHEITDAKDISQIAAGDNLGPKQCRVKSQSRLQQEADLNDILQGIESLDKLGIQSVFFACINVDRMPRFAPDDINLFGLAERLSAVERELTSVIKEVAGIRDVSDRLIVGILLIVRKHRNTNAFVNLPNINVKAPIQSSSNIMPVSQLNYVLADSNITKIKKRFGTLTSNNTAANSVPTNTPSENSNQTGNIDVSLTINSNTEVKKFCNGSS